MNNICLDGGSKPAIPLWALVTPMLSSLRFPAVVLAAAMIPLPPATAGAVGRSPSPPRVVLGDPVVVSQASPEIREWGPWQFPVLERMRDGRIHLRFHVSEDSASAYGMPVGHSLSSDNGRTWKPAEDFMDTGGLPLKNGDRLRSKALPSVAASGLKLPPPVGRSENYGASYVYYGETGFPPELRGWHVLRLPADGSNWVEEAARVKLPGAARYTVNGILPIPFFWRLRLAPDGSVWAMQYGRFIRGGKTLDQSSAFFLRSTDGGRTWNLLGEIPYRPDRKRDPLWQKREGFTEPDVAFLRDGSVLAFVRTTDGNGPGPMYAAFSKDGGRTWGPAEVFDEIGVWPTFLTLDAGIILVAYGRPGLFIRATTDPAAKEWSPKIAVVPAGEPHQDTCSYADLLALDDRTALLAYSDFDYPNPQGIPVKSILVRTLQVLPAR